MATVFKRGGKGPWIIQWYDHKGDRREVSSRSTDKRRAEQLAQKLESDKMLRKTGIIDASTDRYVEHRKSPIGEHLDDYLADLRHRGCHPRHTQSVERRLKRLIEDIGAKHLSDLDPVKVQRHLRALTSMPVKQLREETDDTKKKTIGPRTVNTVRSAVLAFLNWCVRTGRLPHNPCQHIPRVDESKDQRVKRRALTAEEVAKLVRTSGSRGSFYLVAAMTGLRMKEMGSITWGDVDFSNSALLVRASVGKAKRDDWIALTAEVVNALKTLRPSNADPTDRVFPTRPTTRTFSSDLKASGIAEYDSAGRRVDRHALRTTAGTLLARSGVMPQEAQRQMRHADIKTTLRHYTDLRLSDQARAVAKLPTIAAIPVELAATGTDGRVFAGREHPQQYSQQSVRQKGQFGASGCEPTRHDREDRVGQKPSKSAGKSDSLRGRASRVTKAGEEDRTPDIQLGKLTFYR